MLTQADLQAIGNIIDQKLEARFAEQEIKLDARFAGRDKSLNARFAEQEQKFDQKLKPITAAIKKLQKDVAAMLRWFDGEYIDLEKRVKRIELHLDLPVQSSL